MAAARSGYKVPNDWYDGVVPGNVAIAPGALLETAFSFSLFRSALPEACAIGASASVYLGTMFDVGHQGRVRIGAYALLNGPRIICDAEVTIGDYSLIAWGVVLMDSYRVPREPDARRRVLRETARRGERRPLDDGAPRPIHIGANVWVGFDTCILPGVSIGDGAVIGARSVVTADIPACSVAGGNPAQVIRRLKKGGHDV